MFRYIVKRVLQAIPILIIISIITFVLMKLAPYDAIDSMVTPNMSAHTIELIKAKYGYYDPVYVQYFKWLGGVLHGDFGYSIVNKTSISENLASRIPATMLIVLPSYIFSVIIALILGLIAGFKKNKFLDKFIDGCCSIGISVPTFWLAMIIMYVFAYNLSVFPIMGMNTTGEQSNILDTLSHMAMPVIVLTLVNIPELTRYVRSSTIGQLSEDYVQVQKAFGATNSEILKDHVLKNVMLPVITIVGMSLPMLVTGAFITETIFSWPGVGPYFVTAITAFDYPVVMAILLLSSTLVIIGNLLSDVLYCVVDPRIREMRG